MVLDPLLSRYRFALVDPSQRSVLGDGLTDSLAPSCLPKASEHLLPGLLWLGGLTQPMRGLILDEFDAAANRGDGPLFCALLDGDVDPEGLGRHLAKAQILDSDDRSGHRRRQWLRLHDPRVFVQILRILAPENWLSLFGPIDRWSVCLNDQWIEYHKPVQADSAPLGRNRWPRPRIADIGILNRTLRRLGIRDHEAILKRSGDIEAQIARARDTYALTAVEDLVEFAARALSVGRQFDMHPAVQALIRDPRDGEDTRLPDRLARIDSSVWRSIEKESLPLKDRAIP